VPTQRPLERELSRLILIQSLEVQVIAIAGTGTRAGFAGFVVELGEGGEGRVFSIQIAVAAGCVNIIIIAEIMTATASTSTVSRTTVVVMI